MLRGNSFIKGLVLAAVLVLSQGAGAKADLHSVRPHVAGSNMVMTGLTINPGFILAMYNVANQTSNNVVNSLPPSLQQWASFVNISVNNSGAPATLYFHMTVEYQGCSALTYSGGDKGILMSTIQVPTGATVLNAGQIQVYNSSFASPSPNGVTLSACLQNVIKSDFSNQSQITQIIQQLMQATFLVCLQQCDVNGNLFGSPVCTSFQFFNQSSTNVDVAPIILQPHNQGICTNLPLFDWTQAMSPSMTTPIPYTFDLSEGENPGDPIIQTISIPAGQVYYQWKAKDHPLIGNKKYWFRVTALNASGSPLLASGSNVWKWFIINCNGTNRVTMTDVDNWCRTAVAGNSKLARFKSILNLMKIQSLLNPSDITNGLYGRIEDGSATVVGVQISTQ